MWQKMLMSPIWNVFLVHLSLTTSLGMRLIEVADSAFYPMEER